ncbi:MAG: cytochrome c1, partial [Pseudomonadota bacterium]
FFDAMGARGSAAGADYVYNILTGYDDAPSNITMMDGMYYNNYFSGYQIAMAPPLIEGGVEYEDGTEASIEQQARDLTTFLAWASEPELEVRRQYGLQVMLFLAVFLVLLVLTKRRIWKSVK